ncbi:MAG: DUF2500 domain-containing protein [Tetrasphaera sp.]
MPHDSGAPTWFVIAFLAIVVLFGALMVAIMLAVIRGVRRSAANRRAPLLNRPATVVAKRTGISGGGNSSASSHYFATFEFPDRSREEFGLRGEDYGLLAEGDQGTVTTQGTRFHGFQRGGLIQDTAAPGPQPFPRT